MTGGGRLISLRRRVQGWPGASGPGAFRSARRSRQGSRPLWGAVQPTSGGLELNTLLYFLTDNRQRVRAVPSPGAGQLRPTATDGLRPGSTRKATGSRRRPCAPAVAATPSPSPSSRSSDSSSSQPAGRPRPLRAGLRKALNPPPEPVETARYDSGLRSAEGSGDEFLDRIHH
jgi:hypothetical protein